MGVILPRMAKKRANVGIFTGYGTLCSVVRKQTRLSMATQYAPTGRLGYDVGKQQGVTMLENSTPTCIWGCAAEYVARAKRLPCTSNPDIPGSS